MEAVAEAEAEAEQAPPVPWQAPVHRPLQGVTWRCCWNDGFTPGVLSYSPRQGQPFYERQRVGLAAGSDKTFSVDPRQEGKGTKYNVTPFAVRERERGVRRDDQASNQAFWVEVEGHVGNIAQRGGPLWAFHWALHNYALPFHAHDDSWGLTPAKSLANHPPSSEATVCLYHPKVIIISEGYPHLV